MVWYHAIRSLGRLLLLIIVSLFRWLLVVVCMYAGVWPLRPSELTGSDARSHQSHRNVVFTVRSLRSHPAQALLFIPQLTTFDS